VGGSAGAQALIPGSQIATQQYERRKAGVAPTNTRAQQVASHPLSVAKKSHSLARPTIVNPIFLPAFTVISPAQYQQHADVSADNVPSFCQGNRDQTIIFIFAINYCY